MPRNLLLLAAFLAVLIAPIALRPRQPGGGGGMGGGNAERTVVIITPHNEAIRYEFGRAFAASHFAKTGERVRVDYRTPGGTSEIARYAASEYLAAFQLYWTKTLGKPWSTEVARAFANPRLQPGKDSPLALEARQAFLDSHVSCGLDLFFGGGAFDFQSQSAAGYLVDSGFVKEHPELFGPNAIPQTVSGEPFWDAGGRWMGNVVSAFGICYNTDVLARRKIAPAPRRWADLGDPRYFKGIALANPTQSSSVNKAFEMLIQQQMQETVAERGGETPGALAEGWARAMRLLMRIGANARYFTDASTKIPLDVSTGDAAAGMSIDFYARFQSESMRRADGTSPTQYVDAAGGTSVGVDPIGLFRGAPHPDLAKEFIAFVFSEEGQKLWNWKPGTPGGPEHYALRRLPVLPALYGPQFKAFRTDPELNPYEQAKTFVYHEKWTGPLFRSIAFSVRVMCIDSHDELRDAWQALIENGFPPEATAVFSDVSAIDYATASGRMKEALGPNKIREVELARELADRFRAQYRRAAELAAAHR